MTPVSPTSSTAAFTSLSFSAWRRLRLFFLLVWINKRFPLTERIAVE